MRKTDNKVCLKHVNLLLLRAFHLHLYVTFIKYILLAQYKENINFDTLHPHANSPIDEQIKFINSTHLTITESKSYLSDLS